MEKAIKVMAKTKKMGNEKEQKKERIFYLSGDISCPIEKGEENEEGESLN